MIISLGESLIDFINKDEMNFTGYPGGSPYNTSIAITRQGVPGQYLGRMSSDLFGKQLKDHLIKNKVGMDLVINTDDHTTLSFVKKDAAGQASYAFFSEKTADRNWQSMENTRISKEVKALHFGSISISQEPCGTTLTRFLLEECRGIVLSFDPNIRPSLVPDKEAYMERFEKLCKVCSIVKMSDEDLEWLYPGMSIEEGIKTILNFGVDLVALTAGKKGAWLATPAHKILSPIYDLPVSDTVGAGDTFHGNLLSFLYHAGKLERSIIRNLTEAELTETGEWANKAAGINCSRPGCNPPTLEEMK